MRQRGRWQALLALAAFAALTAPSSFARARTHYSNSHHSEGWARDHFAGAERMREALNGRPAADRTRHDYQRVLNAYRSVYLGAPVSSKADPSVVAVAETLVEMGRHFNDDKILKEAIAQYKFLRREYPGSKYRFDGLFTIGEIYKDDLNDPEAARTTFQEFLRRYPNNHLTDDARQAILELDQQARAEKAATARPLKETSSEARKKNPKDDAVAAVNPNTPEDSEKIESAHRRSGRLPRVTGIRHWSTPDYTRVAIDVESDVKFSSQRIATPARIFFDLHDTKLASTLVGKSFDVDDGFLKKVRVAQFAPGRTRVVLDVDSLSDYNAFLLPNPYRLIIDIHGKGARAKRNNNFGENAPAEADVMSAPKTSIDTDSEQNSHKAEHTSAAQVRADLDADVEVEKVAVPTSNGANATSQSVSQPLASSNKVQPVVVKKVVDVDDDEDQESAPKLTKRVLNISAAKTSASKKSTPADPDVDLGPADPDVSASPSNNVTHSSRRTVPRTLASSKEESASALSVREASPTARGDRSLIRALGLKIGKIVIDPGHGGHDTGTIGPNGLEEKDLVLEVGRRLGKLLETRLGAEVVYTRKDDTFIPLETRTAVANQARADLFVSIHANSSHDESARGVETYYLNFTSSPEALEVAARENAVSEKSIFELQDLVKKIALKEKIEESREFAGDVQQSLHSGLAVKSPAIRDRGVKKAPFIVLIGANMPSILAEISFVSNPTDEHRLATSEYRQRIAESLYRGIAKYVNGLSGVKVASKMDKTTGQ